MRLAIPGLTSSHPISEALPDLLAGDEFVRRLTEALDATLAPVLTTLDCLDAYLDPRLTPEDMLPWLAGWLAVGLGERMSEKERRALVAGAFRLHQGRGALEAVAALLRVVAGVTAEVVDSGGCAWSSSPGGPLPGTGPAEAAVRVPAGAEVDLHWLRAVVELSVPAHVRVSVTVEPSSSRDR
ncbi:phage tail protein [Nonomuraea sp. NPDC047897]|uniref:phage tail protein n=1 Tax=Nonomuraea sp. NPDC047897 TaxID=3364346 RepID=UPI0037158835